MNASYRLNTCKSRGSMGVAIHPMATGARVRNTYPIYPWLRDSLSKERLIPDGFSVPHGMLNKDSSALDEDASD